MKTLNGKEVRIKEFDGKFYIQVKKTTNTAWFWQKPKIEIFWQYIGDNGKETWDVGLNGQYGWCNGKPVQFSSLEDAKQKIDSIDKGEIIHNLE